MKPHLKIGVIGGQSLNSPLTTAVVAGLTSQEKTPERDRLEMDRCPKGTDSRPLHITATGRGSYCRTRTDKFGFPRLYLPRTKLVHGFQTGDIVRTPKGVGRIAVRTTGSFALKTPNSDGKPITVNHKHCRIAQRADGYNYANSSQG